MVYTRQPTTFVSGTVVTSLWTNWINQKAQEVVSVLDYGATGDGITDDTTAIQAAINTGKSVYFPDGTYIVTALTTLSNQRLSGNGPSSILKQKAGSANFTRVITVNAQTNVIIEKLHINGNGNAQQVGEQNHGIFIVESTNVLVQHNIVHDCQGDNIGVYSNTDPVTVNGVVITNNIIYNLGRSGIVLSGHGARSVIISNNSINTGTYITTSTSKGNAIHLELDNTSANYIGDVVVQGNTCIGTGITSSGNFTSLVINGNTVRNVNQTIAIAHIGIVAASSLTITNNVLEGDNTTLVDGISVQDPGVSGAPVVHNVLISGNIVEKIAGQGITIFGSGFGIPSIGRVIVTHNILDTIGTGGSKSGISIVSAFPTSTITNNIVKGVTNVGVSVQATSNFTISGNTVSEFGGSYGVYIATKNSIGVGPGQVFGNIISHSSPTGKTGIRVENEATNNRVTIFGNDVSAVQLPINIGALATNCSSWGNVTGNASVVGSFTLSAAATTVVTNANVTSTSKIILVPTNAAAATLMGSAKALYISARTAGTSFTVATANAVAAAGTETFDYWISS